MNDHAIFHNGVENPVFIDFDAKDNREEEVVNGLEIN